MVTSSSSQSCRGAEYANANRARAIRCCVRAAIHVLGQQPTEYTRQRSSPFRRRACRRGEGLIQAKAIQNPLRARTGTSLYVLCLSKLGLDEDIEISMRHYVALAKQYGMRSPLRSFSAIIYARCYKTAPMSAWYGPGGALGIVAGGAGAG